jgi:hypothetical protein
VEKYGTLNTSVQSVTTVIPCACGLFLFALRNTNTPSHGALLLTANPPHYGGPGTTSDKWRGGGGFVALAEEVAMRAEEEVTGQDTVA